MRTKPTDAQLLAHGFTRAEVRAYRRFEAEEPAVLASARASAVAWLTSHPRAAYVRLRTTHGCVTLYRADLEPGGKS